MVKKHISTALEEIKCMAKKMKTSVRNIKCSVNLQTFDKYGRKFAIAKIYLNKLVKTKKVSKKLVGTKHSANKDGKKVDGK